MYTTTSTRNQLLSLVFSLAMLGKNLSVVQAVGGPVTIPILDTAFDGINAATQAIADDLNSVQTGVNDLLALPNVVSNEIQNQIQAMLDAKQAAAQSVVDGVNTAGNTVVGVKNQVFESMPVIFSAGLLQASGGGLETRPAKQSELRNNKKGRKKNRKKNRNNKNTLLGRRLLHEVDV